MPACVIASESVGDVVGLAAVDGGARSVRLGEAEIQHLDRAVGSDLDVGGLEIAMDDALFVRGFERRRRSGGRSAIAVSMGTGPARSSPSTSSITMAPCFDAVDGGDVGMVQRGQHLRFALEAGHAVGVCRRRRRAAP